jgi:DNA polymerase I-like protein with 3'-5' exonuclease and polymerase domains
MGDTAAKFLLDMALADSIKKMIGAFRNHPIQGSVADIAELAFSKLMGLTKKYPELLWVQTVHDSISGECSEELAVEICTQQKKLMEEAMEELLPGIPAKVDAEVGTSLDDSDVVAKIV